MKIEIFEKYPFLFASRKKEKPMENIPKDFEDKIEQAYYYFKDRVSSKGGMERDYFKQTLRHYFREKQSIK